MILHGCRAGSPVVTDTGCCPPAAPAVPERERLRGAGSRGQLDRPRVHGVEPEPMLSDLHRRIDHGPVALP
jgi:hypothetical protein